MCGSQVHGPMLSWLSVACCYPWCHTCREWQKAQAAGGPLCSPAMLLVAPVMWEWHWEFSSTFMCCVTPKFSLHIPCFYFCFSSSDKAWMLKGLTCMLWHVLFSLKFQWHAMKVEQAAPGWTFKLSFNDWIRILSKNRTNVINLNSIKFECGSWSIYLYVLRLSVCLSKII